MKSADAIRKKIAQRQEALSRARFRAFSLPLNTPENIFFTTLCPSSTTKAKRKRGGNISICCRCIQCGEYLENFHIKFNDD